jgi:dTDP-glucose 4,6-dehydratase
MTGLKTVVVTGGAGFLGSALCDRFVADGWRVVAVDNFCTGAAANVAHLADDPRFELIEANVSDGFDVAGSVDAVLHFASPASPKEYQRLAIETLRVGSVGTMAALQLADRKGARFLMASTSEIYGDPLVHPQTESYWGNVNTLGPRSMYDEAKRFSEAATMTWRDKRGVDTRIVRIFNTYGPRMAHDDGRVVPNFVCQALRGQPLTVYGDGSQTRSFCYVTDTVDGIMRVLLQGDHMPYNVGNPAEHTIEQFAKTVAELAGGTEVTLEPLPGDDPKRRKPDITRISSLGWQPQVPLADGLQATVDYFRSKLQNETTAG